MNVSSTTISEPAFGETLLSAQGLHLSFGLTHALRGIDFEIAHGERVAIMGPSGSGKSTLLHVLAGVLTPDEGEVRYGKTVVSGLGEADRARLRLSDFGFVFQFGQLIPDLSAIDNVSIPLLLAGMSRKRALGQARAWLDQLRVADHASKLPTQLSGGQAQCVAIARALVTAPKVLFADEPTGALDSLVAESVMETLTDVTHANRTTLVIVTHDARTASYTDREIVVRDGRVSSGYTDRQPARR
ncbi:ABC transporter ATP-binding protein [Agreia bicolorata]|uniref:ABC transporter ATP-binding protein n=1 Tax=Agreia bicolorata TaxID=110935 RepID=A0ABR5CCE4_9MICO|nr:ABC transporter ATP-binding protein [Agreia bicolorata]KJC63290.1 ABC transporter ATP-binding protein [Agreia bicolorata]